MILLYELVSLPSRIRKLKNNKKVFRGNQQDFRRSRLPRQSATWQTSFGISNMSILCFNNVVCSKSIFFINSLNNTDLFMSSESLYIKLLWILIFFYKVVYTHFILIVKNGYFVKLCFRDNTLMKQRRYVCTVNSRLPVTLYTCCSILER
jgi:hypothetical protein